MVGVKDTCVFGLQSDSNPLVSQRHRITGLCYWLPSFVVEKSGTKNQIIIFLSYVIKYHMLDLHTEHEELSLKTQESFKIRFGRLKITQLSLQIGRKIDTSHYTSLYVHAWPLKCNKFIHWSLGRYKSFKQFITHSLKI